MSDTEKSSLDAVGEGPVVSEPAADASRGSTGDPSEHPSVAALLERYGDAILKHRLNAGDQWVVWVEPDRCHDILTWLKEDPDHRFDMMSDVTGVDYGKGRPVEVVYQMFSTVHGRALRVRCPLALDALEIESVCDLWKSANWLEREVYDMFGVTFRNHPDLRRILMPPNYAEGHPLRKDFPLRGRFSRAEQTRRALDQDVARYYEPEEIALGDPQQVAHPAVGTLGSDEVEDEG
ncbi:MAG: NADH-quinone oxidoreductase subunit C [Longimicrobiales bacterium]|nr:NADH-quinone oxidoreductase subunit C [Longimicrobiales bacterium]